MFGFTRKALLWYLWWYRTINGLCDTRRYVLYDSWAFICSLRFNIIIHWGFHSFPLCQREFVMDNNLSPSNSTWTHQEKRLFGRHDVTEMPRALPRGSAWMFTSAASRVVIKHLKNKSRQPHMAHSWGTKMIKTEKILHLKRKFRVVREHYLRERVPCYSSLCQADCENGKVGSKHKDCFSLTHTQKNAVCLVNNRANTHCRYH